jgi:hypothetical protein
MPMHTFLHNLQNVLVQIANKMGLQKEMVTRHGVRNVMYCDGLTSLEVYDNAIGKKTYPRNGPRSYRLVRCYGSHIVLTIGS